MRRIVALCAAALSLAVQPRPVEAQSKATDIPTTADCAGKPSKDAEITCLRDALERSRRALEGDATPLPQHPTDVEEARAPTRPSPAPAPAARGAELGTEQLKARQKPPKATPAESTAFSVVVADATTDARGIVTLRLENGQVWREKEQPDVPVRLEPNTRYQAELSRSGFGGYRLRILDKNRTIVVERVR